MMHNWKYVGETKFAKIWIDHKANITKIETIKYIYYHKGLYPFQNPDPVKKIKK